MHALVVTFYTSHSWIKGIIAIYQIERGLQWMLTGR